MMKIMQQVHRSVRVNAMHLIVLGLLTLYDGATFLREKVPWAWVEVSMFQRPLSGTGGVLLTAWHMHTTSDFTPMVTIGREQRHCDRRGGGLASAFKPRLRRRQGLPLMLETVPVVGGSLAVNMTPR